MVMDYKSWYDYNWERLQDDYDDYCFYCADNDEPMDSFEDWLSDEYESYVSEFEDRAYDEYKDSLLD